MTFCRKIALREGPAFLDLVIQSRSKALVPKPMGILKSTVTSASLRGKSWGIKELHNIQKDSSQHHAIARGNLTLNMRERIFPYDNRNEQRMFRSFGTELPNFCTENNS